MPVVAVEDVGVLEFMHSLITDLDLSWILGGIQDCLDGSTVGGRRSADGAHDYFAAGQGATTPVDRDTREEPVLDLVPLRRSRREMTDRN